MRPLCDQVSSTALIPNSSTAEVAQTRKPGGSAIPSRQDAHTSSHPANAISQLSATSTPPRMDSAASPPFLPFLQGNPDVVAAAEEAVVVPCRKDPMVPVGSDYGSGLHPHSSRDTPSDAAATWARARSAVNSGLVAWVTWPHRWMSGTALSGTRGACDGAGTTTTRGEAGR